MKLRGRKVEKKQNLNEANKLLLNMNRNEFG